MPDKTVFKEDKKESNKGIGKGFVFLSLVVVLGIGVFIGSLIPCDNSPCDWNGFASQMINQTRKVDGFSVYLLPGRTIGVITWDGGNVTDEN